MKIDEFQHVVTEHEPLNLQMELNDEVGFILACGGPSAQEAFNAQPSHQSTVPPHGEAADQSSSMPAFAIRLAIALGIAPISPRERKAL